MFVRSCREPAAVLTFVLCLVPATCFAAQHHVAPSGIEHMPTFTFSIGRHATSGAIHMHDFSRDRETMKPFELATPTPKPEPTFPSFSNPLHRHRMAMIAF